VSEYRAIVSIYLDDEDLEQLAEFHRVSIEKMDIFDVINAELDNISGRSWIEQIYKDKRPSINRLTRGIKVEISDFE
jgi:hypothetical protein